MRVSIDRTRVASARPKRPTGIADAECVREILDDFGEMPFDVLLALARRGGSRVPAEQLKHQFSL